MFSPQIRWREETCPNNDCCPQGLNNVAIVRVLSWSPKSNSRLGEGQQIHGFADRGGGGVGRPRPSTSTMRTTRTTNTSSSLVLLALAQYY